MPVTVFACFWLFRKLVSNSVQTEKKLWVNFFWTRRDPRRFGRRPEESWGSDKLGRRVPVGRLPVLWVACGISWPNSASINSQIFPWHERATWNAFSVATNFRSREMPSRGLCRYSVGGRGVNHGGALHQPCRPSVDVWVVYHRPMGP
mgnify:CR=1 FL=1